MNPISRREQRGEERMEGTPEREEERKEGGAEVMEQKHIKLHSSSCRTTNRKRQKHPHKHKQNGTVRLGSIHSVSSRGGMWLGLPSLSLPGDSSLSMETSVHFFSLSVRFLFLCFMADLSFKTSFPSPSSAFPLFFPPNLSFPLFLFL